LITTNDIDTIIASTPFSQKGFENLYIASRKKEIRVYTDEQVEHLPLISHSHIHYREWQIRKRSATRLFSYLGNKNKPLLILEAGCGNGWLSARLAAIRESNVTGTDINKTELEQAMRLFGNKPNLKFTAGDIREIRFEKKFDTIIFAASIQYFSSFENIIQQALSLLNETGEIHIIDSYFYKADELEFAKERSLIYYQSIGFEAMAEYYFHHSIDSLKLFNHKLLFDPAALKNKFFGNKDPFPWIRIKAT
jgi:SAM-dependent methyltransferase